jgi:histidyl-tRNA synthetase
MEISGLPGFRDFFPDDLEVRRHIFSAWRTVARRYGFQEYDGPPLEPLELYTRKSGAEIVEQLYGFTDKGGREVALRPEMTPTFARMISARASALPKPIRWYAIPQLFRYERPQRGRLREHFQLNMDIVGETDVLADAEIVSAALDCLRTLGLDEADVVARVSDRRLMGSVLVRLGVSAEKLPIAFAALDRLEREPEDRAIERLGQAGADESAARRILKLGDMGLEELLEAYGDEPDVRSAGEQLTRFLAAMSEYGLGTYVAFSARLVRGLAYYTGLVFELWERNGELRAICGGGRYDDLLASLGGVDLPAVGFGMGDVVLGELLRDRDLLPEAAPGAQDFVVCVSEEVRPSAMQVIRALRESGRSVTFELRSRGVGRQFKTANRAGVSRVIIVGPDEIERGVVRVREMSSGEESDIAVDAIAEHERGAE